MLGVYLTKYITVQHVLFMAASREVMAAAKIEVDISTIPEGSVQVVKWQGKPVFIFHR